MRFDERKGRRSSNRYVFCDYSPVLGFLRRKSNYHSSLIYYLEEMLNFLSRCWYIMSRVTRTASLRVFAKMLKILVVFLCALNALHALSLGTTIGNRTYRSDRSLDCYPDPCRKPDYYWRQYTGEIPDDALVGGYDEEGYNIYVGQVLYGKNDALIPANIFVGRKGALSCVNDRSYWYDLDVKILCAQNRNDYRWVSTSVEHFEKLSNVVPGGTEILKRVYIGRTHFDERLIIGKIFENKEPNKGLWIPKADGGTINILKFDILLYEPRLYTN